MIDQDELSLQGVAPDLALGERSNVQLKGELQQGSTTEHVDAAPASTPLDKELNLDAFTDELPTDVHVDSISVRVVQDGGSEMHAWSDIPKYTESPTGKEKLEGDARFDENPFARSADSPFAATQLVPQPVTSAMLPAPQWLLVVGSLSGSFVCRLSLVFAGALSLERILFVFVCSVWRVNGSLQDSLNTCQALRNTVPCHIAPQSHVYIRARKCLRAEFFFTCVPLSHIFKGTCV